MYMTHFQRSMAAGRLGERIARVRTLGDVFPVAIRMFEIIREAKIDATCSELGEIYRAMKTFRGRSFKHVQFSNGCTG